MNQVISYPYDQTKRFNNAHKKKYFEAVTLYKP